MKIKAAIVIAAVAGVALSAPTSKSECTPLFVGELKWQKFPHGEGMYQPPPEEGKVQYTDGNLIVAINATHGSKVTLERCGQHKIDGQMAAYGRVVLDDKKCLVAGENASYVHAGKCDKQAEFVRNIELTGDDIVLSLGEDIDFDKGKNNTLVQRRVKEGDLTRGLSIVGKRYGKEGEIRCMPVYTDVLLQYSGNKAMVEFKHDKLVLGNKGSRVTLEACTAPGFKEDIYGSGGRARVNDKCVSLDRTGKETASLKPCADGGEELEKQWFNVMENMKVLSKTGGKSYWKMKGKEVAYGGTDDVKGDAMIYK